MNRIQLLLADVKAKALMRQVLEKHMQDIAPIVNQQSQIGNQQAGENVSTSTSTGAGNVPAGQEQTLPPDYLE